MIKETQLWSRPASSLTGTTATLSDSMEKYDYLSFTVRHSINTNTTYTSLISITDFKKCVTQTVGQNAMFSLASRSNYVLEVRQIYYISSTSIGISGCYRGDSGTGGGPFNDNTLPIRICGIKNIKIK